MSNSIEIVDGYSVEIDDDSQTFTVELGDTLTVELTDIILQTSTAGASDFLGLTDTPNSYVGQGGLIVAVNVAEDALEFITNSGGYTDEQAQDAVGGMLSGNVETLITVTYQDATAKIDFVVNSDLSLYNNATSAFLNAAAADALFLTPAEGNAAYQPLDSDLTAIAALAPTNDDVIQRKAGAWTNRTMAQLIADLAALGTTFQPLDADLTSWAAITRAAGFDTFATTPTVANLASLLTNEAAGWATLQVTPTSANLAAFITDDVFSLSDAELGALAGLTSAADKFPYFTGSGTAALADLSANMRTFLTTPSSANLATLITDDSFTLTDAELAAIAGLVSAADKFPYFTGSGTAALADLSANMRTFLTTPTVANLAAVLSNEAAGWATYVVTPTSANFAAFITDDAFLLSDVELGAIAGLVSAADQLPYFTGSGTAALTTLTATGRSIIDDASVAAVGQTLFGADPNADRIIFWDDSAGAFTYLTPGTGLTITGTTIDVTSGFSPPVAIDEGVIFTWADSPAESLMRFSGDRWIFSADAISFEVQASTPTTGKSTLEITSAMEEGTPFESIGIRNITTGNFLDLNGRDGSIQVRNFGHIRGNPDTIGFQISFETLVTNDIKTGLEILATCVDDTEAGFGTDLTFVLDNDGSSDVDAGKMECYWTDPTDGAEYAALWLSARTDGVMRHIAQVASNNVSPSPDFHNALPLGIANTNEWSDLFLGSGAVVGFNNGDVTITHSADLLTVAGGDLAVPDEVYGVGWDGSLEVPTKNALYDKIQTISAGSFSPPVAIDEGVIFTWTDSPSFPLLSFTGNSWLFTPNGPALDIIGVDGSTNYLAITNAIADDHPRIIATGFDPDIRIMLTPKGGSDVWIDGKGLTMTGGAAVTNIITQQDPNGLGGVFFGVDDDSRFIFEQNATDELGMRFRNNAGEVVFESGGVPGPTVPGSVSFRLYNATLAATSLAVEFVDSGGGTPVNYLSMTYAATGLAPAISVKGDDASIGLTLKTKASSVATDALKLGPYAADAGFDVLMGWDDSLSYHKNFLLADILTEAAPAAGDFVLIYGAEGDLRKVNWSGLPGGSVSWPQAIDEGAVFTWSDSQAETLLAFDADRFTLGVGLTFQDNNAFDLGDSTHLARHLYTTDIELGAASDTTIARSGAGAITVEGVQVVLANTSPTLATITTTGNVELGNASDTTLARAAAGRVTVEGVELLRPAAQADQETSTSNIVGVTPGTQQFHPASSKFWVYWTANSTTILKSFNMTSIADTATGDADGTIATDFSDANWCGIVCTSDASAAGWDTDSIQSSGFNARAAGTFGVLCGNMVDGTTAVGGLVDPQQWNVVGYGDQA